MNRKLMFGIAVFVAFVVLSLVGSNTKSSNAFEFGGHCCGGCFCDCRGTYGRCACWSGACCGGYRCGGCYSRAGCYGCRGCYAYAACHGCGGCYGCGGCCSCAGYSCIASPGPVNQAQAAVIYETTPETSSPATTAHPATSVTVTRFDQATPLENDVPRDAVLFTVRLPQDATLFVNGQVTTSVGNTRQFISRRLVEGAHYAYTLRVEMPRGQTPLVEERLIVASAGESRQVSFGRDTPEQQIDRLAKTPDSQ